MVHVTLCISKSLQFMHCWQHIIHCSHPATSSTPLDQTHHPANSHENKTSARKLLSCLPPGSHPGGAWSGLNWASLSWLQTSSLGYATSRMDLGVRMLRLVLAALQGGGSLVASWQSVDLEGRAVGHHGVDVV